MVLASLPPVLQPLSALTNQNTAAQTNVANNATSTNAANVASSATINKSFFDGLVNKFKATNASAQQTNEPVSDQVSSLADQLAGQVNQNPAVNSSTGLVHDSNLSTDVSINNLNANLSKWQNYLADNDYSFTLLENSSSQSNAAINVNVANGQVSSASYTDGTALSTGSLSSLPTIEQMFANIQQAYANGERVDALYNPSRGFPEYIFFGHASQNTADDASFVLNNVSINA